MSRRALAGLRVRVLGLVAAATVPALAFILSSAWQERAAARRRVEAEAMLAARVAAREHARQIGGARDLLTALARDRAARGVEAGTCPPTYADLLRASPHLANIGVLGPSGVVSCSVVPAPEHADMSDTPAFLRARASLAVEVGEYQIGRIVRRPVLVLAAASRDPGGVLQDVPFVALDLAWFGRLASDTDLPEGSSFAVVDRQGTVLARSEGSDRWVGARIVDGAVVAMVAARRRGAVEGFDVDGVRRLFAFDPLFGAEGVGALVGIPGDRALAGVNRALWIHLAWLALVALLSGVAGWIGADVAILRSVRGLGRVARALGGGDLSARAPDRSMPAEIHDLAVAFDAMAAALETRAREAAASREQLRALSQRIHEAREEQSARIARDLHDELGQELTALRLDVASAERLLGNLPPPADAARERLAGVKSRIEETVHLVRRLASELRPALLDQLGLGATLEWQAHEFERRCGIPCTIGLRPVPPDLDPQVATIVFRIFQEALTNVSRHARARSVHVDLGEEEGRLVLVVRDDGKGIPEDVAREPSTLGLLGMRERAAVVGGTVTFAGRRGEGTIVTVSVPIPGGRGDAGNGSR